MRNRILPYFFISILIFLLPSCAKLVNGDIDETIEDHLSKIGGYDNVSYVPQWTFGDAGSDSVLYSFEVTSGTTYKIFIRDYDYGDYYSTHYVKFSIVGSTNNTETTYVAETDTDCSKTPYLWTSYTTETVYIKMECNITNRGKFYLAIVLGTPPNYTNITLTKCESMYTALITVNCTLKNQWNKEGTTESISISEKSTVSDLLSKVNASVSSKYTAVYTESGIKCSSSHILQDYGTYILTTSWLETLTDLDNSDSLYSLDVGSASSNRFDDYEKVYLPTKSSGIKKYYQFSVSNGTTYHIQWADYYTNSTLLTYNGYNSSSVTNGKYTIYNDRGNSILSGDNDSTMIFTASSTGTYFICIANNYNESGTVAIRVYSE